MNDNVTAKLLAAAKAPKAWVLSAPQVVPTTVTPIEGAISRRRPKS
jgi:hypothetical protein